VDFDVQHRDCFDSLAAMRNAGGARLIVTSPPYPDARTPEQYGCAAFDTTVEGYGRLGEAIFEALMPGGVCAFNIDGPIRVWRPELGESERSLIAFKVAIDWAERVGFRYVEEPVHIFARPGAEPVFNRKGYTIPAANAGQVYGQARARTGRSQAVNGWEGSGPNKRPYGVQPDDRMLSTIVRCNVGHGHTDTDHGAPFARDLADAYVLCYSQPGDIVGDPFVGSGTVAFSCHRHDRRFIGGDLGHRERDGRRWADIVRDGLRQERLFPMEALA
jgi:hypothetical protein